jgi:hypothetical protein
MPGEFSGKVVVITGLQLIVREPVHTNLGFTRLEDAVALVGDSICS